MNRNRYRRVILTSAGGPSFDPDYQSVLDYATAQGFTLPSAQEQIIANQLMIELKGASSSGLVGYGMIKIYATNINYGGSVPANLGYTGINWVSPGSNQTTRTNTITQTLKQGYSSDATTSFMSENYALNTLPQNNVFNSTFVFNPQNPMRHGVIDGGVSNGHLLQWNGTDWQILLNGPLITIVAGSLGSDVFVSAVRNNSADVDFYENGVLINTTLNASTTPLSDGDESMSTLVLPAARVFQNADTITSIRIKGLAADVDQAALYTAVYNYLIALAAL